MGIGAPKDISECRRFFQEPRNPKSRIYRMYEALRAYFIEGRLLTRTSKPSLALR